MRASHRIARGRSIRTGSQAEFGIRGRSSGPRLIRAAHPAALVGITGCVEVSAPSQIAGVSVFVPTTSLARGESVQAVGMSVGVTGSILSGRTLDWISSNTAVATVSSSGMITAVGLGSTEVKATANGHTGAVTISVLR